MNNDERPSRLEPTRAQISGLAGAGDNLKGTGAVDDTPDGPEQPVGSHEGPGAVLTDEEWRASRIGTRVDLAGFRPPEEDGWSVLPPSVVRKVEEASEIKKWYRIGDYHAMPISGHPAYQKSCEHVVAWAFHLGWSEANLTALAATLKRHVLDRDDQVDAEDVRLLVAVGRWLVEGGPAPWPGRESTVREPSRPGLGGSQSLEMLELVRRSALDRPWPGRTGQTDRKVLLALVRIGESLGRPSIELYASVRRVADESGVNKETVQRSLRRLEAAGFLSVVHVGGGMLAGRYELRLPGSSWNPYTVGYAERTVSGLRDGLSAHPAFRADCLGQPCQRLTDALQAATAGLTDVEWRRLAKVERRPFVETYLPRLTGEVFGVPLVAETDDGWVLLPDLVGRLDRIAEISGAAARVRQRHERHLLDQHGNRMRLARRKRIDTDRYEIRNVRKTIDRQTGEIVPTESVFGTLDGHRAPEPSLGRWSLLEDLTGGTLGNPTVCPLDVTVLDRFDGPGVDVGTIVTGPLTAWWLERAAAPHPVWHLEALAVAA